MAPKFLPELNDVKLKNTIFHSLEVRSRSREIRLKRPELGRFLAFSCSLSTKVKFPHMYCTWTTGSPNPSTTCLKWYARYYHFLNFTLKKKTVDLSWWITPVLSVGLTLNVSLHKCRKIRFLHFENPFPISLLRSSECLKGTNKHLTASRI